MPKIPTIKTNDFIKFIEKQGCYFQRQKGSHQIYDKPNLPRPLVVPIHTKDLPEKIIRSNLRTLSIKIEDFLKEMKKKR